MLTRKAKNSLKFKAAPKEVILKIKTPGNRITTVKTTGRILQKGEYAFVSIPAIFQLTKNGKEILFFEILFLCGVLDDNHPCLSVKRCR